MLPSDSAPASGCLFPYRHNTTPILQEASGVKIRSSKHFVLFTARDSMRTMNDRRRFKTAFILGAGLGMRLGPLRKTARSPFWKSAGVPSLRMPWIIS